RAELAEEFHALVLVPATLLDRLFLITQPSQRAKLVKIPRKILAPVADSHDRDGGLVDWSIWHVHSLLNPTSRRICPPRGHRRKGPAAIPLARTNERSR